MGTGRACKQPGEPVKYEQPNKGQSMNPFKLFRRKPKLTRPTAEQMQQHFHAFYGMITSSMSASEANRQRNTAFAAFMSGYEYGLSMREAAEK
jgi:hypothetical protein